MSDRILKIANIGDIHLGHHATPTKHIIRNLDREITNALLDEIDLLTLAGDVQDKLLNYNDGDVADIEEWITRLLYRCAERNVVIRVVEGTPSHDRNQSRFFVRQAVMSDIPVDVAYFDKVAIEHIKALGVTMLYVPDIAYNDPNEVNEKVKLLLLEEQLEHVDFALMHGAFPHQLPDVAEKHTFSEEFFTSVVKHLIFIGDIHTSLPKGKIIASGSFDRLKHKEEEAKGMHKVTVNLDTGVFKATFIENKGAKIYKTVDVRGLSEEALWGVVQKLTVEYPVGSAFSLLSNQVDSIAKAVAVLRSKYSEFKWMVAVEKDDRVLGSELRDVMNSGRVELKALTPEVMMEQIDSIMTEDGVDSIDRQQALLLLNKVLL